LGAAEAFDELLREFDLVPDIAAELVQEASEADWLELMIVS
jgi:hypothetical protein